MAGKETVFLVIDKATGEPHEITFSTGMEAKEYAISLNSIEKAAGSSRQWKVKKQVDKLEDWKLREQGKFDIGVYKHVPWHERPWVVVEHYCHVSRADPNKVAFTPDEKYGIEDRRIRMRPGRYLEKLKVDQTRYNINVRQWCAKYVVENVCSELKFATEADEIEDVYRHGPHSCMVHSTSSYGTDFHPVRVYAAGDLAVAYLSPNGDHVTARALVWPEKKLYGRIYGDAMKLSILLKEQGYKANTTFTGAKLLKVNNKNSGSHSHNTYIMPYLDGPNRSLSVSGDFFIIDEEGHDAGTGTGGKIRLFTCGKCTSQVFAVVTSIRGAYWCQPCIDEHAWCCNHCSHWFESEKEKPEKFRSRPYCQICSSRLFRKCEICERNFYPPDHWPNLAKRSDSCLQTTCSFYRRWQVAWDNMIGTAQSELPF